MSACTAADMRVIADAADHEQLKDLPHYLAYIASVAAKGERKAIFIGDEVFRYPGAAHPVFLGMPRPVLQEELRRRGFEVKGNHEGAWARITISGW